jgi:hypothetical protein
MKFNFFRKNNYRGTISYYSASCISALLILVNTACADEWNFHVAPYAWLAGVDGDLSARGRSVSFDQSFSDLVSDVNVGVMGRFEATNNEFILTSDIVYIDLGSEQSVGSETLRADMKETILELGGGYHIGTFSLGECGSPTLAFDMLAGARYFNLNATIKGPFGRDPSNDLNYWEPYIGPRLVLAFNEKWSTALRTDIGGFGLGNDPGTSWQLTAGVKYQATKLVDIGLGYKFLNIYDLDRRDASADIKMAGLIMGVGFSF